MIVTFFFRAGELVPADIDKINDILAKPTGKKPLLHHSNLNNYRLQHSQVVPQQTERYPRGQLESAHFQRCWHQAQRGLGKIEEDQSSQRSQTPLGLQGQRSEDQVNWQNWKNPRSRQKEVSRELLCALLAPPRPPVLSMFASIASLFCFKLATTKIFISNTIPISLILFLKL